MSSPAPQLKQRMETSVCLGWASAFSLLNSTVCRSSIVIAPSGQTPMQKPMPSQSSSDTTFALPFMIRIAPSAQGETHFPQPVHFSSSIFTIIRFTMVLDLSKLYKLTP